MPLKINYKVVTACVLTIVLIRALLYIFTPILLKDLDRYQTEQTKLAIDHLTEQLGITNDSVLVLGGSTSGYKHGSFEMRFQVGSRTYKVVHENSWWRQLMGLKGRLRIC